MTTELKERLVDILRYYGINMDNTDLKARIMHCMKDAYALDHNEWVSVEKSFPKESGYYLTWSIGFSRPIELYYSIEDRTFRTTSRVEIIVTHWMNLPNPPTK